MPTTIIPYQSGMTTGGSWTYVGTLSPAPSPPGTYNGSIDFAGYNPGLYVYRYTIPAGHSADITINWQGTAIAPVNDACAGGTFISGLLVCPGTTTLTGSNLENCAQNVKSPTDSGVTKPASWTYASYVGDLWYKFTAPVCQSAYQLSVTVQGTGTSTDALGIALQVFRGSCSSLSSITDTGSTNNTSYAALQFQIPALQVETYYLRVASVTAGNFSIGLACTSSCTPGNAVNIDFYPDDETAGLNGVAINEIYGLSADNIYGLPYGSIRFRIS